MRKFLHIVAASALVFCVFACGREGRVIPPKDMARIYVRMLLTDQWLRDNYSLSKIADTSLVYEPVLNEFGYNSSDYIASVGHYMKEPEKFGKIFDNVKDILQERIDELTFEERKAARLDSIRRAIEASPFRRAEIFRFDAADSARLDTVRITPDSTGLYVWERIIPDTVYYGPAFHVPVKDTVAVSDSLAVSDTLAVPEGQAVSAEKPVRSHGRKALPVPGKEVAGQGSFKLKNDKNMQRFFSKSDESAKNDE
ncbi:MAG: DUF4296 domain-containing protein [Candidatus Cryptobacteroides sp.]